MPKRTREQQDKHNENRRKVKKEGKKSHLMHEIHRYKISENI